MDDLVKLIKGAKVMVINFSRPQWCSVCIEYLPKYCRLIDEFNGLLFAMVDCDKVLGASDQFKLASYPTVAIVQNGQVKQSLSGKELDTMLKNQIVSVLQSSVPSSPKSRMW